MWLYGEAGEWRDSVNSLREECVAHAFMLAYNTILSAQVNASNTPHRSVLLLKSESSLALRKHIQAAVIADTSVLNGIIFFFAAALFMGDATEATLHGTMLRTLLYQKFLHGGASAINPVFLARCLCYESHNSMAHMTPTIFHDSTTSPPSTTCSADGWITTIFRPHFAPVSELLLPVTSSIIANLDHPLHHQPLHTIFSHCRQSMYLHSVLPTITNRRTASVVTKWIVAHSSINRGRITNYYLSLQSQLDGSPDMTAETEAYLPTQAGLCLATFVAMVPVSDRSGAGREGIVGQCTGIEEVWLRLQSNLNRLVASASSSENEDGVWWPWRCAVVWVAFVAARAERMQVSLSNKGHEIECTSRYRTLASWAGARTWEQVRQMLVGFIFGDEMQTGLEAWAAKAITGHVGKD